MVYSNLTNLQNIQGLQLNNSIVNNTEIVQESLNYLNSSFDAWIIIVSFCLFIGIFYMVYMQSIVTIDIPRAILFASSIVLILNFILILSQWVTNIYGFSIFAVIFILMLLWIYFIKQGE